MQKFKKRFGQNFITNKRLIKQFVNLLNITPNDNILEVGPGDGRITLEILKKEPKNLVAIEIDKDLMPILKDKFVAFPNFELINTDFLKFNLNELNWINYKVIGALPYNISKRIIRQLLFAKIRAKLMIFILQKEVALNYITNFSKSTFLSLFTDILYEKKYIKTIDSYNFYPRPKVESGIIVFKRKPRPIISDVEELKNFQRFLINSFRAPRKMLKNVLKSIYHIENLDEIMAKLEIDKKVRAENLNLNKYIALYKEIQTKNGLSS